MSWCSPGAVAWDWNEIRLLVGMSRKLGLDPLPDPIAVSVTCLHPSCTVGVCRLGMAPAPSLSWAKLKVGILK